MPIRLLTLPKKQSLKDFDDLLWQGNATAEVMIVVDPVVYAGQPLEDRQPLSNKSLRQLAPFMKDADITGKDVVFLSACRPVSEEEWKSDSKLSKVLKADHEKFLSAYRRLKPKLIVTQGKAAISQVLNRPVKITKIRGVAFRDETLNTLIMPTLGIGHVVRVPEHGELFTADLQTASRIMKRGFKLEEEKFSKNYKYCYDLGELIASKPALISVDTEYSCYGASDFAHWYIPQTKVLTVQLTVKSGESLVVPIDYGFGKVGKVYPKVRARLVRQLKQLFEDPTVRVIGQNFKSDALILLRKLGIRVANYSDDIMLMAHLLNENMLSKALDDIARVYLPNMAGYKDEFRRKGYDYRRMDLVPPEDLLEYSGGDSDAVFQLYEILLRRLVDDQKLYNCYLKVVMPAMRAFIDIEQRGFQVNKKSLETLRKKVKAKQEKEETRLMAMIPQTIKDEFADTGVGLKLTRDAMLRAFLFTHPLGLKLKPLQFTKGSTKENKVPSCSSKTHLPYFIGQHPFIEGIIAYIKNDKMLTTYIGEDGHVEGGVPVESTGFWKYIYDNYIRPSYSLHRTVTGRTASSDPNGQNFPKRGEFAAEYRAIFEAPDGWTLLEADYSQLELRIAGILAREPTFLRIYREGGDIHCMTAAVVMGISFEKFMALKKTDPEAFKMGRFRAKAVNFGLIYGMGWRKFMVYAKTEYGITYTDTEAQRIVAAYFSKYRLRGWHDAVKEFVNKHGYVRCIDGRVRHLPAVVVDDDGVASSAERQAINSPVQGFGSDLGLIALARINAELPQDLVRVIGFIHDSIVCIAKVGREMEAARAIKRYMETNPLKEWFGFEPPIPILAEVSLGKNLADMIEVNDNWLNDSKVVDFNHVRALANKDKKPVRLIKLPKKAAA